MLEDKKDIQKNLKDTQSPLPNLPLTKGEEQGGGLSYNKTNKLVSALYMVTDIMDKEEPLRNKLRNLGTNIISDIYSLSRTPLDKHNKIESKISEILSFLEIASSVSIISEMNCSILTKEFIELRKSIIEITPKNNQVWLEEFMKESDPYPTSPLLRGRSKEGVFSNGHSATSIGVQRGGTLLQALSRVEGKALSRLGGQANRIKSESIDVLKNKRREEIVLIIKDKMKNSLNFSGVTITDIKNEVKSLPADKAGVLASCGEKTLQRELVSMVSGGVLKKTGEKRWSRYAIK